MWAASKKDKLEKRNVTLGEYNADTDTWEIVNGLTADEYIAYPDDTLKAGMSVTKYDDEYFNPTPGGDVGNGGIEPGLGEPDYSEPAYEDPDYQEGTGGDDGGGTVEPRGDNGGAATGSDLMGGSVG